jgi:hypothetical protein
MINPAKIRSASSGLVGIRQPSNPDYAIFDAQNLLSSSGYFIDEVALFKGEYFIDAFCSKDDSASQQNDKYRDLIGDSAVSVANRVYNKPDFIDREVFYSHANNYTKLNTSLNDGFVGYKLQLDDTKNSAFKISRLWIEVDNAVDTDVDIILWNTHDFDPIQTKTVSVLASKKSQQVVLNWVIDNVDFYKGDWYIGYVYDGTLVPYEREYENSSVKNNVKSFDWRSVYFPNHMVSTLPDLDQEYDLGGEYNGLNLDVSVYMDFTNFVVQNLNLFSRAIQLQSAIQVLHSFVSSNRSNLNERYAKEMKPTIMAFLKGTKGTGLNEKGLENHLTSEITMIQSEIEKLAKGQNGGDSIMVGTIS